MYKGILHIFFVLCTSITLSQQTLVMICNEPFPKGFEKKITINAKASIAKTLSTYQNDLINIGYLAASIDSTNRTDSTTQAFLHLGNQYKFAQLTLGNLNEEIASKTGVREKLFINKPVQLIRITAAIKEINRFYENHGFPFSSVTLKLDSAQSDLLYAHFHVKPHKLVVIDSIHIKGINVNRNLILNAIKIRQGEVYNQSLINQINNRIKEIGFVSEAKPAELVFKPGICDLYIYLKKKNANRFNGILGVLSDRQTGKINFTGELDLSLLNAFNKGEAMNFSWRRLQNATQELQVGSLVPYIFNLPFGIGLNFDLYKRDSTYLEVSPEIELRYQMNGANYVGVYYRNYQSRLLDPSRFASSISLPRFNDTKKSSIGIKFQFQDLNYVLNPRKGYDLTFSGGAGFKTILVIPNLDSSIYNNIALRTNHYELKGNMKYYLPLIKRTTLMLGVKGSYLINNQIFINEMTRLGGLKTIRGFDDQSILASSYFIGTAEYRFLLERNSYVFLFTDIGYFENRNPEYLQFDRPTSFGAGISFQTKAGIFALNYAMGKLKDTQFLLRSAKIHFGFINYF